MQDHDSSTEIGDPATGWVHGYGLSASTLAAELGDEPTWLVFLRHYG